MPVSVSIPIRLKVDTGSLLERQDDIADALAAAVGRALRNSRDLVLADRGGFVGVQTHLPAITWRGDGLAQVPMAARAALEAQLTSVLANGCRASGIFDLACQGSGAPEPLSAEEEIAEGVDASRLYELADLYELPSYQAANVTYMSFEAEEVGSVQLEEDVWRTMRPEWHMDRALLRRIVERALARWGRPEEGTHVGLMWQEEGAWGVLFVPRGQGRPHQFFFTALLVFKPPEEGSEGEWLRQEWVPPPGTVVARVAAPPQDVEQRRATLRGLMREDIRAILFAKARRPPTMSDAEFKDQLEAKVEAEIERRLGFFPAGNPILQFEIAGENVLMSGPKASDPGALEWEGDAILLPVTSIKEVVPGEAEGEGGAEGAGKQGAGEGGEGAGLEGGIVYTGEEEVEETGGPRFPTPAGPALPEFLETGPFLDEPPLSALGSDGESLRQLMAQIAIRLQIVPCDYAGRFCLNAAEALRSRAEAVESRSVANEGITKRVQAKTGNLGALEFVPTASPAIQILRHLAGVTPFISELARRISEVYRTRAGQIGGHYAGNAVGWALHLHIELTSGMKHAIGTLFMVTCRVLLLQLLRASRQAAQSRLDNFPSYAPLFEKLVRTNLANVDELLSLRDTLRRFQRLSKAGEVLGTVAPAMSGVPVPLAVVALPADWRAATHGMVAALATGSLPSASSTGAARQIVQVGGTDRIRDGRGNLWTMDELEEAIATRRGFAEDIDPLVKQITDLPEVMQRFRANPETIRVELRRLLEEMLRNNQEITAKVVASRVFAFRASKIREDLPASTIPGTSFALQGIHMQAHGQIGEFFWGDPYYAMSINALFQAELGIEELTSFFEFTGMVLLSILCPPLAAVVGIAMASVQYAEAKEREQIYESLMDPDLVLSRAEVEAELFAAQLGLALSFIPEVGPLLRVGRYGLRAAGRAGIAGGARIVGRYAARRITRHIVEAISRGLIAAFTREVMTNVVMNHVIEAMLEPVMRQLDREARITGPVGGSEGAESTMLMLEAERRTGASAGGE